MTAPTSTKERRSVRRGMALVLLATVGFGLNPLFARWAYLGGLTPETALVYRFLVPAAALAPFLPAALRAPAGAGRGLALGVFVGVGTLTYFRAIAVCP